MLVSKNIVRSPKRQSKNVEYIQEPILGSKATKQEAKDKLISKANGISYDADVMSITYMSAVVATANAKYNKLCASGMVESDAYTAIYKSQITWKGSTNTLHTIQIESLVEALEDAMIETANIVGA